MNSPELVIKSRRQFLILQNWMSNGIIEDTCLVRAAHAVNSDLATFVKQGLFFYFIKNRHREVIWQDMDSTVFDFVKTQSIAFSLRAVLMA